MEAYGPEVEGGILPEEPTVKLLKTSKLGITTAEETSLFKFLPSKVGFWLI